MLLCLLILALVGTLVQGVYSSLSRKSYGSCLLFGGALVLVIAIWLTLALIPIQIDYN